MSTKNQTNSKKTPSTTKKRPPICLNPFLLALQVRMFIVVLDLKKPNTQ